MLAEALAVVDNGGEGDYEAELYRLKGELTLQQFHVSRSRFHIGKSPKFKVQNLKSESPNTQHLTASTYAESEAEACFLQALEIAREQQAKSLELRAVMSLVQLRKQQALEDKAGSTEQGGGNKAAGKRGSEEARRPELRPSVPASQHLSARLTEAHRMLSDVYNWFTEGFETQDLREAKALLDSLES